MTRTHWLLLGALALPACGGDGTITIPPPEPPPTPTVQLALSQPISITANLATPSGTVGGATITRSDGFNGAITMSAESVPTGWTVSFSPAVLGAAENTTSVLVTAPANVVAGSYSFIVRATAIGVATASSSMTVVASVEQGN